MVRLKPSVRAWLDRHLDPDWRVVHKLWSAQVAVFGALVSGLWVAVPAFQNAMPPLYFAGFCMLVSVAGLLARMGKQDVGSQS